MNNTHAIEIKGISKRYQIGAAKSDSLGATLTGVFKGGRGPKDTFWALKDVSFNVGQGEAIAIIGKNGAGKSTLLKILSQITQPTEGRIEINGRIASLLEVGTGFHPELTGRENIYLNGTILGMTRKEVAAKFDEIVEFSGVGKFIETPVKHYSSGMYVRLAFSVAAHLEPEILVIDEVLAVGDVEFQEKCLGKMQEVSREDGRTVIFVSHQLGMISKLCKRAILLENGKIIQDGKTADVIRTYLQKGGVDEIAINYKAQNPSGGVYIDELSLQAEHDQLLTGDPIVFNCKLVNSEGLSDLKFGIAVSNSELNRVFTTETKFNKEEQEYRMTIPANTLTPGTYLITAGIHMPNVHIYDQIEHAIQFTISDNGSHFAMYEGTDYGSVFVNCNWEEL